MKKKINLNIKIINKFHLEFKAKFGDINIFIILINEIFKYILCYNYKKDFSENFFPFINNYYLNNNILLNNKYKESKFTIFKNLINKINFDKNDKKFAIQNNLLKKYLDKKKIENLKEIYFEKVYFKNLNLQKNLLRKFLIKVRLINKIKNIYFDENFINFYSNLFSENKNDAKIFGNKLIIGSNQILKNRIMASKYLIKNKKVISLNHSNFSYSIFEKNISVDSEYSLCSEYFDSVKISNTNLFFMKGLKAPKLRVPRSKVIKNFNYKNSSKNILYLPKKFIGHERYFGGIYNQVDDKKYFLFQKKILKFNKKVLIKIHPKNKINYEHNINEDRIIKDKLNKMIIDNCNLIIVDSITQPFFDLAKSNKKILFIDSLGQKLKPEVYNLVKKRAYIIKIDLNRLSKKKFNSYINNSLNFKIKNKKISNYSIFN